MKTAFHFTDEETSRPFFIYFLRILLIFFLAIPVILLTHCQTNKSVVADKGVPAFHKWAPTPPMGWNSWDCYGPTVVEDEVKANADYMAAHLKKFGWEYIVVDIRWYVANDKSGGYNEKILFIIWIIMDGSCRQSTDFLLQQMAMDSNRLATISTARV